MWKFYFRKRRATDKGHPVLVGRGLALSDWRGLVLSHWQEIKARRPTCKKKVKTKPWHRLSAFIARTNGLMCWNREWRNNNELLALFYCSFEWIKRPSEKKGDGGGRTWETKLFFVENSPFEGLIFVKAFSFNARHSTALRALFTESLADYTTLPSLFSSPPLASASTTSDNGNDKRLEQIENEKQTKSFVPRH